MQRHYSKKRTLRICISLLILVFLVQLTYSQEKKDSTDFHFLKKNSIKGFVFAFPIIVAGASVGYERQLSKHSALELVSNYRYFKNGMDAKKNIISVMPAYKFYTISKSEALNNIWISLYLSYVYEISYSPEYEGVGYQYYYGAGISVGKRINISNNKTYLDIGFGMSYNYYAISKNNNWKQRFLLRPIIQFGQRF